MSMVKTGLCLIAVGVLGLSTLAHAASLPHPGAVVVQDGVYDNIVEISITDPLPLYGAPSAGAGNVMMFPLPSFTASASDDASDLTGGAVEFTFDADPGKLIGTMSIFESGSYSVSQGGAVSAAGTLTVRYFDELAQAFVLLADPIHMVVSPGGIPAPGDMFPVDGPGTGTWLGAALIDFADLGIETSSIIVAMDNTLVASALAGGSATISKDALTINTTIIPEPASLVLMGLGLLMFAKRG